MTTTTTPIPTPYEFNPRCSCPECREKLANFALVLSKMFDTVIWGGVSWVRPDPTADDWDLVYEKRGAQSLLRVSVPR